MTKFGDNTDCFDLIKDMERQLNLVYRDVRSFDLTISKFIILV